jgi:hypothetical protein
MTLANNRSQILQYVHLPHSKRSREKKQKRDPTNQEATADLRCYFDDRKDHRPHCRPPESKYTPLETRSVLIKATLHRALQAAFGWTNSHSYSFSARDTSIGNRTRRYKLFVSLLDPEMQPESYYMSVFDDDQPIHDHCYPTLKANQLRYGDLFGHEGLRDAEW